MAGYLVIVAEIDTGAEHDMISVDAIESNNLSDDDKFSIFVALHKWIKQEGRATLDAIGKEGDGEEGAGERDGEPDDLHGSPHGEGVEA